MTCGRVVGVGGVGGGVGGGGGGVVGVVGGVGHAALGDFRLSQITKSSIV